MAALLHAVALHAVALPGGAVLDEVYEELKAEILARISAAGPLDGLLLDIHGAMSVVAGSTRRPIWRLP